MSNGPGTVIEAPTQVTIPVAGDGRRFPVRRVYCVGRNYAEHALEMGHDPDAEPPFFFQKNPDDLECSGRFPYPTGSGDVHHEIELVVALKRGGQSIAVSSATDTIFGFATGLDMTRRDLQSAAKKAGRPWEIGKAFDRSAPIAPLVPVERSGPMTSGAITLNVNGDLRQSGDLDQMIWKVPEIIAHLSALFTLAPGDLIMTGTPSGVAAVQPGDRLRGEIAGLPVLDVVVEPSD